MTQTFQYEDLTWPQIAELPRDTPLVIPLGSGYPLEQLCSALGDPKNIVSLPTQGSVGFGMLPPIPYGWAGSGLQVADHLLSTMLDNLVNSLRDDGFTRVYSLIPQGIDLNLATSFIALPHHSQAQPAAPIPKAADLGKVILIPIGHTEQHGYHLPMSTDTLIIEAVAQGTAEADQQHVSCLPVMPYGVSTHRASFAGTLNCGGRAFEDFWLGVIDSLTARGFEHFYLLSGHGGNSSFLVNVIKYAGENHPRIFCATSWLYLSGPKGVAALEAHRQSPVGGMGHACELETSLILYLRTDLVHMEKAIDETDFISTPSYYMDWVEGGALIANPPWADDSRTGAYGAGSLGTAEKGQLWLKVAIEEKRTHVLEIIEQQARRQERRSAGYGLWGNK